MSLPSAPFDAAKSIYAGLSVLMLKIVPQLTGVTATAATDLFNKAGHTLANGMAVLYVGGTGFTGLVAGTVYYVRDSDTGAGTYKLAATPGGAAIDITVDGTVGIFQQVLIFESKMLTHKDGREFKMIERPDAKGVSRVVRKVCVKGAEEFTYELDEAKRLVTELFDGALSGIKEGTATIWEPDPSDATGKVALKSETDFACDIVRDGDLKFGDGDASKATLKLSSRKQGDVIWTADAAA